MHLSDVEQKIIYILRELKPHERVEFIADQLGRLDNYIVHHSYKEVLQPKK